jgi:hypothetical protein
MGRACSTIGKKRNAYSILLGKPPMGRPRCRWVDNIKMDLMDLSSFTVLSNRKLQKKPVMTISHLMAGTGATPTISGILNLLQTKGNRQYVSTICQTLSQTFRESLIILLQILNMTTTCYYTDTDCTEDRKQINDNFSIYRSWEPYDVVPMHCLLDGIDKENLHGFSCHGNYLNHSSVYTVFNFIYIIKFA